MTVHKVIRSDWYPADRLIVTQISGLVDQSDIMVWEQTLNTAFLTVPDSTEVKIFVNLYGFTASDLKAHQYFRSIIPITLASYGWKVGYLAMFPDEAERLTMSYIREIRCIAAAHCHQDETKIEKYQALYSSANEHFFTEPDVAELWVRNLK
ncbi:hypothetical protein ACWKW6_08740 [Dyadobacter jiangsuensis]